MSFSLGFLEDALAFSFEMILYYKCIEDPNPTLTAGDKLAPSSSRDRFVQRRTQQGKYIYAAMSLVDLYLWFAWDWASVPNADRARLRTMRRMGLILLASGSLFRIWAMETLGRLFTFQLTVRKKHKVINSGPFGLVRHPSYTGALIMVLGEFVVLQTGNIGQRYLGSSSRSSWVITLISAIPVCMTLAVILPRIEREEAMLVDGLGQEYRQYRKQVPRRLIPGVL